MDCPKCNGLMETVDFKGFHVEKCSQCEGLWFHNLEHELLKNIEDSELLDTGDAKTGASYDTVEDYLCPNCSGHMVKLVDHEQPHIWYEVCHSCYGVFFDAGEFRDLKEQSFFDTVARFFVKERR